jgi:hypothetical protein
LFAPSGDWASWRKVSCYGIGRGDTDKLRRVSDHLNTKLREAVDRANQALGGERVLYVDRAASFSAGGHELCGPGDDWLNGVSVRRGGTSLRHLSSFHPNAAGHRDTAIAVAQLVAEKLPDMITPPVELAAPAPPSTIEDLPLEQFAPRFVEALFNGADIRPFIRYPEVLAQFADWQPDTVPSRAKMFEGQWGQHEAEVPGKCFIPGDLNYVCYVAVDRYTVDHPDAGALVEVAVSTVDGDSPETAVPVSPHVVAFRVLAD